MTEQTTPLRQRMIDDMNVRNMAPLTQAAYVRAVKNFAAFHRRSPDLLRDEPPRPGLQLQANDQDLRGSAADGGDQNLIASLKPRAPIDQTGISTVTAGKHAAALTSITRFPTASGMKSDSRRLG